MRKEERAVAMRFAGPVPVLPRGSPAPVPDRSSRTIRAGTRTCAGDTVPADACEPGFSPAGGEDAEPRPRPPCAPRVEGGTRSPLVWIPIVLAESPPETLRKTADVPLSGRCGALQWVRRFRPFARLLRITAWPPRVDFRARKPWTRFLWILEGWYVRFILVFLSGWAVEDSNLRPLACQASALTT